MSRENVEIVRWLVEAFNNRDLTGYASKLHEDVEWVPAVITRAEAGGEEEFRGGRVEPRSMPSWGRSSLSAMGRSSRIAAISTAPRPSKPWGCGSRVAASAARDQLPPFRYGTAHRLGGPG